MAEQRKTSSSPSPRLCGVISFLSYSLLPKDAAGETLHGHAADRDEHLLADAYRPARYFEEKEFYRNNASHHPPVAHNIPMIGWRKQAERDGHKMVESICAFAEPGAATVQSVYEELRDMILDDLRAALPVDGILLHLHGAMISERCDDCEGDVLARVRQIVGPNVVVGVEYDLHCHLTEQMRANADVTIIYKEYPHTDIAERGEELYDLVTRAVRREIRPVTALHDCRMVYMWRTPVQPMRGFVDRMQALEGKDGILSVSFGHQILGRHGRGRREIHGRRRRRHVKGRQDAGGETGA